MKKTNAMRLLDKAGIVYETREYEYDEEDLSGVTAAAKLGLPPEQVFKSLVLTGGHRNPIVCIIPVNDTLDLKAVSNLTGEKKVEMVPVKEILSLTGYVRGGCSPIGMKKKYPSFIGRTALDYDKISISAGVRGCQILINPQDLIKLIEAKIF